MVVDSIKLIYNTNGEELRSMHPGKVRGPRSLGANMILPDRIVYNDGYLNSTHWYQILTKNNWIYIDNSSYYLDGKLNIDKDFSYTAAHEIGHEIIKFYANTEYSFHHEGSSDNSNTIPVSEGGFSYPISGEIDLMKYFNPIPSKTYIGWFDFDRIVANEKDVTGLLWLSKIKITMILTIFISILSISCTVKQKYYEGYVYDKTNKPITKVSVKSDQNLKMNSCETDTNGFFKFENSGSGVNRLFFSKKGYITDTTYLFIIPHGEQNPSLHLVKNNRIDTINLKNTNSDLSN